MELPSGLRDIPFVFGSILSWSWVLGILYAIIRLGGARIDPLEWYYQNVPLGLLKSFSQADMANSKSDPSFKEVRVGTEEDRNNDTSLTGLDLGKFLSPEYVRYAGLLLIVSALFAFLFRIEWSLTLKIIGAFAGSVIGLAAAEYLLRTKHGRFAAVFFLVAFALGQFGTTLLLQYYQVQVDNSAGKLAVYWLVLKTGISTAAGFGLLRYRSSLAAVGWLIIAYMTPASLERVVHTIPLQFNLTFTIVMAIVSLGLARVLTSQKLAITQCIIGNAFVLSLLVIGYDSSIKFSQYLSVMFLEYTLSPPMQMFIAFAVLFLLQIISSASFAVERQSQATGNAASSNFQEGVIEERLGYFELVLLHIVGAITLIVTQNLTPQIDNYFGITLLSTASISFIALLIVRSKGVSGRYADTLLNLALLLSVGGMFLNTRGPWSALVFLAFSCAMIYVSFTLGTNRTKGYAFVALTVSLFRLYTTSQELFDSIPGTVIILFIGVVLLGLSYKLETIKRVVSGASTKTEKEPQL